MTISFTSYMKRNHQKVEYFVFVLCHYKMDTRGKGRKYLYNMFNNLGEKLISEN